MFPLLTHADRELFLATISRSPAELEQGACGISEGKGRKPMRQLSATFAAVGLLFGVMTVQAAEFGTAEEAKAMLDKAVSGG
jgi:hypothetical protein